MSLVTHPPPIARHSGCHLAANVWKGDETGGRWEIQWVRWIRRGFATGQWEWLPWGGAGEVHEGSLCDEGLGGDGLVG